MWFKSIEILKELQAQYEYNTYEYEKAADITVIAFDLIHLTFCVYNSFN